MSFFYYYFLVPLPVISSRVRVKPETPARERAGKRATTPTLKL